MTKVNFIESVFRFYVNLILIIIKCFIRWKLMLNLESVNDFLMIAYIYIAIIILFQNHFIYTWLYIKEDIKKGESFCIQTRPFKREKDTERKPFQLLVVIMRKDEMENAVVEVGGMCICKGVSGWKGRRKFSS